MQNIEEFSFVSIVKRDPQWSRHSVARDKIRAASAGDFIVVRFALIGSLESPPSN